jgi:hypothetical protein
MGKDAESILAMGAKERGEKKAFASAKKEIKRLKEAYEKVEAGVKGSEKEDRHVLHRRNPGHATEYHTISTTHRGGKALDRPDVKVGKPKYIKKIWDKLEEEQIDESDYAMKKFKTKTNTRVKKGLHADGEEKTILVTRKGDPRAAGGGGVRRIPKHRWDPTKYNMASE